MTIITNNLYAETTRGPLVRLQPAEGPGAVVVKTMAAGSAGTLPRGTPIYVDTTTGFGAKIIPGSATALETDIWGFLMADVVLNGTNEVLAVVMQAGSVHYDDILAIQAAGTLAGTEANLKTALRKPLMRARGLHVDGLDLLGGA